MWVFNDRHFHHAFWSLSLRGRSSLLQVESFPESYTSTFHFSSIIENQAYDWKHVRFDSVTFHSLSGTLYFRITQPCQVCSHFISAMGSVFGLALSSTQSRQWDKKIGIWCSSLYSISWERVTISEQEFKICKIFQTRLKS